MPDVAMSPPPSGDHGAPGGLMKFLDDGHPDAIVLDTAL